MPALSSHLPRQTRLPTLVYAATLLWTGGALIGSLVNHLFVPIERAEPTASSANHVPWCTGELLGLRVELEEALLQELASRGVKADLTRAEQMRRRSFNDRLQAISARCQHSDLAKNSALGLAELDARYGHIIDDLHQTRVRLAQAVDATLDHLKND